MFYYLSGTVAHIEPYLAVIDCGGVGFACRTTSYTLSAMKKGDKGKLFTYLNVCQYTGQFGAVYHYWGRKDPYLRPRNRQKNCPEGDFGIKR